jgi:quercetin dioxygenase-like cupin family protein
VAWLVGDTGFWLFGNGQYFFTHGPGTEGMDYGITELSDLPVTDLSTVEDIPPDLEISLVDDAIGCDRLSVNVWYFEEGDEIGYHAHEIQEELFYVIEGEFSVKLGRSGETEIVEVGEGVIWTAAPMIGRGHRCISDEGGIVLAIGTPKVTDPGLDPHDLTDEEIHEARQD